MFTHNLVENEKKKTENKIGIVSRSHLNKLTYNP